jgi:hypothetical protein
VVSQGGESSRIPSSFSRSSSPLIYQKSAVVLPFPLNLKSEIHQWGMKHISNEDVFVDPNEPTYGRRENSHMTLSAGLNERRTQYLRKARVFCPCHQSRRVEGVTGLESTISCLHVKKPSPFTPHRTIVKDSGSEQSFQLVDEQKSTVLGL